MHELTLNFNLVFCNRFVKYIQSTAISLSSVGAPNHLSNLKEGLV